jgi:F0F1-type ATP synthase epsilon subunit
MKINLRLATPSGDVFFGPVSEVSLRTSQGTIQLSAGNPTYLGKIVAGTLNLRVQSEWLQFALFDASASAHDGALAVMAVEVRKLEASHSAGSSRLRRTRHE